VTDLPLAGAGCALDSDGAVRQGERYADLGGSLIDVEREGLRLTARFGAAVDEELLREAIAVERACCSFFSIAFDADERTLELTVADARHAPALDAVQSALTVRPGEVRSGGGT